MEWWDKLPNEAKIIIGVVLAGGVVLLVWRPWASSASPVIPVAVSPESGGSSSGGELSSPVTDQPSSQTAPKASRPTQGTSNHSAHGKASRPTHGKASRPAHGEPPAVTNREGSLSVPAWDHPLLYAAASMGTTAGEGIRVQEKRVSTAQETRHPKIIPESGASNHEGTLSFPLLA